MFVSLSLLQLDTQHLTVLPDGLVGLLGLGKLVCHSQELLFSSLDLVQSLVQVIVEAFERVYLHSVVGKLPIAPLCLVSLHFVNEVSLLLVQGISGRLKSLLCIHVELFLALNLFLQCLNLLSQLTIF